LGALVIDGTAVLDPGRWVKDVLLLDAVEEMNDAATGGDDRVRQDPPVAAVPVRLGAHESGGRLADAPEQPVETFAELIRLGVIGLAAERVDPKGDVARFRPRRAETSQLGAAPDVLDAIVGEHWLERRLVELRVPPRRRHRANVDDAPNLGRLQEFLERVDRPAAMADAVQQGYWTRLKVESSEASGAFDILGKGPERALGPIV
jgi:hypothetical protein